MTSLDLAIGYHKLDTEFFRGHVRHTTFRSGASRGGRRVAVVTNWYRGRELGRGTFGTVYLERSGKGEYRAVKEIAKDKNTRIIIDYRRELMAMAMLAKHDALFVQLLGWYESDDYVHIAMEYISNGHLRHYLEVERSEGEAGAITRQLLEGLLVIHREGLAHRDLKPENILVVSTSPIWVKIGDFGLAKLASGSTAFRTMGGTRDYVAPEAGIDTSRETSEYTNAIDIWALGCITHEMLTQEPPFRSLGELSSYCLCPKLPKNTMLSKNISKGGIEFVERALAYPPEYRITAREALDLEWLRPEDKGAAGLETEEGWTGPALPERPASPEGEAASGGSLPGSGGVGFHNRVAMIVDIEDQRATEVLLLGHKLRKGFLSKAKGPVDEEMPVMAKCFDMLESLGQIDEETMRTTKANKVLKGITRLPFVPHDEEFHFRQRSIDLLEKWNEHTGLSGEDQVPTLTPPAVKKGNINQGVEWEMEWGRDAYRKKKYEKALREQLEQHLERKGYEWDHKQRTPGQGREREGGEREERVLEQEPYYSGLQQQQDYIGVDYPRKSSATLMEVVPYPRGSFECPIPSCGLVFKRLEHLKIHERTHTQERPHVCNHCNKAFYGATNLAQHLIRTHDCDGNPGAVENYPGSYSKEDPEPKDDQLMAIEDVSETSDYDNNVPITGLPPSMPAVSRLLHANVRRQLGWF